MGLAAVYALQVLDFLGSKSAARRGFAKHANPEHDPYIVYCGAKAMLESNQRQEAKSLLFSSVKSRPSLRCGRLLIHVLIKDKDYQGALDIARHLVDTDIDNPWPYLLVGDIQYFFLNDKEGAFESFNLALKMCKEFGKKNPLKVAYKRVCKLLEEKGDNEQLILHLMEFIKLESSNFHDHEFLLLTDGLLVRQEFDKAKEVLSLGIKAYPRSLKLRTAWEKLGFGTISELPSIPVRGKVPPTGVFLEPVKTKLFTEDDDPVSAMKDYILNPEPEDIATLSSCVAGLMEGRFFMEGAVEPGFLARTLSRFVDQKDIPFGGAAPMANPLSMQVLLEEIGTVRTFAAAVAGGVGKFLGKKGWFYMVAGEDAGQIDDVLGSLPPYDYYVIMGPLDPPGLSQNIASEIGCEAAIVDANDLGVAWAVGYSSGVDPAWLEEVMSSNPAGNQEQQTPIVLVKKRKKQEAAI